MLQLCDLAARLTQRPAQRRVQSLQQARAVGGIGQHQHVGLGQNLSLGILRLPAVGGRLQPLHGHAALEVDAGLGQCLPHPRGRVGPATAWIEPGRRAQPQAGQRTGLPGIQRLHIVCGQAQALHQTAHRGHGVGPVLRWLQAQQAAGCAGSGQPAALCQQGRRAEQARMGPVVGVHGAMEQGCGVARGLGGGPRVPVQHLHLKPQLCQRLGHGRAGQTGTDDQCRARWGAGVPCQRRARPPGGGPLRPQMARGRRRVGHEARSAQLGQGRGVCGVGQRPCAGHGQAPECFQHAQALGRGLDPRGPQPQPMRLQVQARQQALQRTQGQQQLHAARLQVQRVQVGCQRRPGRLQQCQQGGICFRVAEVIAAGQRVRGGLQLLQCRLCGRGVLDQPHQVQALAPARRPHPVPPQLKQRPQSLATAVQRAELALIQPQRGQVRRGRLQHGWRPQTCCVSQASSGAWTGLKPR